MLSKFFLERPVFAWVIAIILMVAGGLAIYTLPYHNTPPSLPHRLLSHVIIRGLRRKPLKTV